MNIKRRKRLKGTGVIGIVALASCVTLLAQVPGAKVDNEVMLKTATKSYFIEDALPDRHSPPIGNNNVSASRGAMQLDNITFDVKIGSTVYDLQTNSAPRRAVWVTSTGKAAVVWITSDNSNFADRGTGYSFFDGSAWNTNNGRIEDRRTGWGNIVISESSNSEVVVAHSPIWLTTRGTIGSGAWSTNMIDTLKVRDLVLWPRIALGANDTIYMIGVTGGAFAGVLGRHPLFAKGVVSSGGNVQWLYDTIIPGLDASGYAQMGGDKYFVSANGNVVAVGYFPAWGDIEIFKSTDYGRTWTQYTILDFPIDTYKVDGMVSNIDGDPKIDTPCTTDESGYVYVDDNGMVHVVYGYMCYLDANTTGTRYTFFPFIGGLVYWNDTMPVDNTVFQFNPSGVFDPDRFFIVSSPDMNNDGQIDFGNSTVPIYTGGATTHPTLFKDQSGNMYVAYTALNEMVDIPYDTSRASLYQVYVQRTCGGQWSSHVWVTVPHGYMGYEAIFPALGERLVNGKILLTYQTDDKGPGIYVYQVDDDPSPNDIRAIMLDTTLADFAYKTTFTDIEVWGVGLDTADYFEWTFGDDTTITMSGRYVKRRVGVASDTTITVTLKTISACGDTVTISKNVSVTCGNVQAGFSYTDQGNLTVTFVNSSQDAASYIWDFGDGNTSTAVHPSHTYADTGTYKVCLIAQGYCAGKADTICQNVTVTNVTSTQIPSENIVSIYPNPVNEAAKLIIESDDMISGVRIVGLDGRTVLFEATGCMCNRQVVDLISLNSGVYILEVSMKDGEVIRTRVVISE